ncbi:MAG: alkaline ceramidase [Ancalomicrobiaceae bacterium]|nr:alkaline ceramidase [Ancalomicrobiaceae bacterium]
MIEVGTAVVDITPKPGLLLAGFAARSEPAIGTHDALTVRAIVVNDTAVVVADVIGLHHEMSERIRKACVLPDDHVIIAALHNHGGPVSMAGRLSLPSDQDYLHQLEQACIAAIDQAAAARRPATWSVGLGGNPDVARNRRHPGGPVDSAVPIIRIRDAEGRMIAVITSYACHPVVLGADNRLWTADYPHFVRRHLEEAYPGAMALFMTGCCGDTNTGHSAHASITLAANPDRTFATAERLGNRIGAAAVAADEHPCGDEAVASNKVISLSFARRETEPVGVLARRWQDEMATAETGRRALLKYWIDWARLIAPLEPQPIAARVTVFNWGGVAIAAMPGEIFAETSLSVRRALGAETPAVVIGLAEDGPGYIPPASEFAFGGYEVDEAHRYYGAPAGFAPGSSEALAAAAIAQWPLHH